MTTTGKAATAWSGLNPRQRLYLSTILDFDQAAEADIRRRSANWETTPPAPEWRQILYDIKLPKDLVGYSSVQSTLREAGQHDSGSGSTLAALERRGLVSITHDLVWIAVTVSGRRTTLTSSAFRHGKRGHGWRFQWNIYRLIVRAASWPARPRAAPILRRTR